MGFRRETRLWLRRRSLTVRRDVLAPLARQIQPVLATCIPATAQLSLAELGPVLARVDQRLATEPVALQQQLRLFVRILWWLPVFTHLRTMGGLSPVPAAVRLRPLWRRLSPKASACWCWEKARGLTPSS